MAIRSGIQLAEPFSERRILNQGRFKTTWSQPWIVQPKLNGERCRLIKEGSRCLLLSSSEDIIPAVPHINQAGLSLPDGEYDGELYVHGMSWSEIHSIVSRETNMHSNSGVMELHLFDLIDNSPQWFRLQNLNKILQSIPNGPIKSVPVRVSDSLEKLYSLYEQYIEMGYEGFIVREMNSFYTRRRVGAMMKFKPKKTDHYMIARVIEAISEEGKPLGMIGAFECVDTEGTYFKVGAGKLSHDARRNSWIDYKIFPEHFKGEYLEIEYQTMSDAKGVPLFSRAVRIVSDKPECGNED
ncbi:MAG TPA: hypothetical protein VMW50_03465 [Dehalococcoidia bacterium]|nr:hypothetical protein [Dehalococcoidia bacterium]